MQKQQGDVIFTKLNAMPAGEHKRIEQDKRGVVFAEGEVTGHYHAIRHETDAELIRIGERMLLKLEKGATVEHEEHEPITLEPGIWEVGQVREWDYLQQMERKVVD